MMLQVGIRIPEIIMMLQVYRDKIYYLTEKKIIIYIKTITTIPEGANLANSYFKLKVGSNSIRGLRVAIMNKRVCMGLMNG